MYPKIAFGCWIAKSRRRRQPSSQSLRQVTWTRSSTSDREGSSHRRAVRIMVRLMSLPTRETNSSHASSSRGPAQRQTTSFSDKDEYRLGLGLPRVRRLPYFAVPLLNRQRQPPSLIESMK